MFPRILKSIPIVLGQTNVHYDLTGEFWVTVYVCPDFSRAAKENYLKLCACVLDCDRESNRHTHIYIYFSELIYHNRAAIDNAELSSLFFRHLSVRMIFRTYKIHICVEPTRNKIRIVFNDISRSWKWPFFHCGK